MPAGRRRLPGHPFLPRFLLVGTGTAGFAADLAGRHTEFTAVAEERGVVAAAARPSEALVAAVAGVAGVAVATNEDHL